MTAVSQGAELTYPLAALLAEPAGSRRDYAFEGVAVDLGEDLQLATPVSGRVRVSRTNRGVFVRGGIDSALALDCSRCLKPISVPLSLPIGEEVLPAIDIASGRPVDADLEPEIARLTDHHELELEPIIREAIQLAEPIAPLCRPDCPGLCSVCGEALETGPHDHDDTPVDPRLEALRAFRVDADVETG
ncbi:MAG: YceD family protein [Candidatus Limnocylindrales bacterium]